VVWGGEGARAVGPFPPPSPPPPPAAPLVHRALGALTELEQALEAHANG
jgi:hypothetical protein